MQQKHMAVAQLDPVRRVNHSKNVRIDLKKDNKNKLIAA